MLRSICGLIFIFALVCAFSVLADEHLLFYASFDDDLGETVKDHSQYKNDGKFVNGAKWSPDGKFIAFSATPGRYTQGISKISIIEIDTLNQILITKIGGHDPSWSPDGKSILFTSPSPKSEDGERYGELYIIEIIIQ